MSKGERIAAITGIWVVLAVVVALNLTWPWFRNNLADLQWVMGTISGWVLCTLVNRERR